MLTEYYFKIKYIKGTDNTKADALSKKKKLQNNNKISGALLKLKGNIKIWYNHPQLTRTHKALKNS